MREAITPGPVSRITFHASRSAARQLADVLLAHALEMSGNRPFDDMTVLVLAILPLADPPHNRIVPRVRRMELHVPI